MTKKIWELPELSSITDDDIFLVANDPAGTPSTRYITSANLGYASKASANVFTAAPQQVTIDSASNKGWIIKAANSQSANLLELQNSSGTQVYAVTPAGNIEFGVNQWQLNDNGANSFYFGYSNTKDRRGRWYLFLGTP